MRATSFAARRNSTDITTTTVTTVVACYTTTDETADTIQRLAEQVFAALRGPPGRAAVQPRSDSRTA